MWRKRYLNKKPTRIATMQWTEAIRNHINWTAKSNKNKQLHVGQISNLHCFPLFAIRYFIYIFILQIIISFTLTKQHTHPPVQNFRSSYIALMWPNVQQYCWYCKKKSTASPWFTFAGTFYIYYNTPGQTFEICDVNMVTDCSLDVYTQSYFWCCREKRFEITNQARYWPGGFWSSKTIILIS